MSNRAAISQALLITMAVLFVAAFLARSNQSLSLTSLLKSSAYIVNDQFAYYQTNISINKLVENYASTWPSSSTTPSSRRFITESYVIALDPDKLETFKKRNHLTGNSSSDRVLWFPGVDGHHQPTLNLWAKLSGKPAMNLTEFDAKKTHFRGGYREPYAVRHIHNTHAYVRLHEDRSAHTCRQACVQ
jgi:hypothetical protein